MENLPIVPILATVIVVATLATIVFAVASYVVFKLRQREAVRPAQGVIDGKLIGEPQFFRLHKEP